LPIWQIYVIYYNSMKQHKITLLVSVILIATVALTPAGAVSMSPWAGFALLTMRDANQQIAELVDTLEGGGVTTVSTPFNSTVIAGIDIGGLRLGYIPATTGKLDWHALGDNTRGFQSSLTTAMVGFRTGTSITGGFYAGYGMATVNQITISGAGTALESDLTFPYSGSNLVAEASLGIHIGGVDLGLSYRYASISQVRMTSDVLIDNNGDGIADETHLRGELLCKNDGVTPLAFDFGGIVATIGVRFGGPKSVPIYNNPYGYSDYAGNGSQNYGSSGYPGYYYYYMPTNYGYSSSYDSGYYGSDSYNQYDAYSSYDPYSGYNSYWEPPPKPKAKPKPAPAPEPVYQPEPAPSAPPMEQQGPPMQPSLP
jgi:hypothetical protein